MVDIPLIDKVQQDLPYCKGTVSGILTPWCGSYLDTSGKCLPLSFCRPASPAGPLERTHRHYYQWHQLHWGSSSTPLSGTKAIVGPFSCLWSSAQEESQWQVPITTSCLESPAHGLKAHCCSSLRPLTLTLAASTPPCCHPTLFTS